MSYQVKDIYSWLKNDLFGLLDSTKLCYSSFLPTYGHKYIYFKKRIYVKDPDGKLVSIGLRVYFYDDDGIKIQETQNDNVVLVGDNYLFEIPNSAKSVVFRVNPSIFFADWYEQKCVFCDDNGDFIEPTMFDEIRSDISNVKNAMTTQIGNLNLYIGSSVNIISLGADSTGNTDISDILTMALNGYDTIYFPKGTYLVSKTVTVPSSRILRGDSAVIQSATNGNCLLIENAEKIEISGITVVGQNTESDYVLSNATSDTENGGVVSNTHGIYIKNSHDISIRDVTCKLFQRGLVVFASSNYPSSYNLSFDNCVFEKSYAGVLLESGVIDGIHHLSFVNCKFVNNLRWGEWMEMDGGTDNRKLHDISHICCEFSNQEYEHGAYIKGRNLKFLGCNFIGNNISGLRMHSIAGARISHCYFNGNGFNDNNYYNYSSYSRSHGSPALFIGEETSSDSEYIRSNGATIDSNTFYGNAKVFSDYKRDKGISFSHNKCVKNGGDELSSLVDLRSESDSMVADNIFIDNISLYCILLVSHGNTTINNNNISRNVISGHTGVGIGFLWNASETDCSNIHICDNDIDNCTDNGVSISSTSGRTLTDVEISRNSVTKCGGAGLLMSIGASVINGLRLISNHFRKNKSYAVDISGDGAKINNAYIRDNTSVGNTGDTTISGVTINAVQEMLIV